MFVRFDYKAGTTFAGGMAELSKQRNIYHSVHCYNNNRKQQNSEIEWGEAYMNQKDYIEMGLNGEAPLKVILRGSVENVSDDKVGVVSLVFATMDKSAATRKIHELTDKDKESYYMVYSVPLDTDLTTLDHYPSIAITKEDLNT